MQSGRTTGKVLLTAGFYSSQQNSPMSWVWASVKRWVEMDWASERRPVQMDWVSEKILAECSLQGLTGLVLTQVVTAGWLGCSQKISGGKSTLEVMGWVTIIMLRIIVECAMDQCMDQMARTEKQRQDSIFGGLTVDCNNNYISCAPPVHQLQTREQKGAEEYFRSLRPPSWSRAL